MKIRLGPLSSPGPDARRPLVGPALAAGLALALEYGGLTWREALPGAPLGLIGALIAGYALLLAGALCADMILHGLAGVGRLRVLALRLAVGRAGWPLFALCTAAGIAAWVADLVLYVRLYPLYHLALGLAALLALCAAMRIALARQEGAPEPPGARLWPVRVLMVILSLAVAHLALQAREDGKAAILGHGIIAADVAWLAGGLSDVDGDGVGWLLSAVDRDPFDDDVGGPDCLDDPPSAPIAPVEWTPDPPAQPLNLLLITVDALRRDHSPSDPRGEGGRHMPAVSKLAEQSVVFTRAYAPAAMTLPSIAALHAGRYPWALAWAPTVVASDETVRHPLDGAPAPFPRAWPGDPRVGTPALDRHPTLAEGLSAAGWATAGWPPHESFLGPLGLGRGFAIYPPDIVRDLNPNGVSVTGHAAANLGAEFITSHLRAHPERPFFAWVHLFDPHHPYRWPPGTDTTADTPLARYRAEVLYTDLQVARLLTLLRQAGLEQSTVVVFTADHGEAFGERGAGYHSTGLFDELTTVPLIIRAPGLAPRRVDAPVSLVDVAPTVGGLLGLAPAATWQGRDLGPLMRGEGAPGDVLSEVAYEQIHRQYLLRAGDWTLIWDWDRGYRQVFDVAADPDQLDNRVVAEPERAERMTAALCAALKRSAGLQTPPAPPGPPQPLLGTAPAR